MLLSRNVTSEMLEQLKFNLFTYRALNKALSDYLLTFIYPLLITIKFKIQVVVVVE